MKDAGWGGHSTRGKIPGVDFLTFSILFFYVIIGYIRNLKAVFILDNHKTKQTHKKENFVI